MEGQVRNAALVVGLAQNYLHNLQDISKLIDDLASSTVSVIGAIDSLLTCFVRCNFLGPKIEEFHSNAELEQIAVKQLSLDGEAPYSLAKLPIALWLSKTLSYSMLNQSTQMTFEYALFYLECLYLHQCLFGSRRVPTLKSELDWLLAKVSPLDLPDATDSEKFTFLQLSSYLAVFYYEFALAETLRTASGHLLSLELEFSGTIFLLRGFSRHGYQNEGSGESSGPTSRPVYKASNRLRIGN
uniref:Tetratricopeptide repeat protein 27 n=1 Tax=Schistocephalus solidus TaxID=70667 RepID=A0A0X3PNG1_SCHSO